MAIDQLSKGYPASLHGRPVEVLELTPVALGHDGAAMDDDDGVGGGERTASSHAASRSRSSGTAAGGRAASGQRSWAMVPPWLRRERTRLARSVIPLTPRTNPSPDRGRSWKRPIFDGGNGGVPAQTGREAIFPKHWRRKVRAMSISGTLGVEEELHIVHPRTGQLVPSAARLLRQLPDSSFGAELQRSTVEINSPATTSLSHLNDEMIRLRRQLRDVAQGFGLDVAAVGMAPEATDDDFELTVRGRYSRMHEDYRLLVDEQLICGYQVHVGVDDRDLAVRLTSRVEDTLPILLALSASSPFWRGRDTGYASMRTMIWQRWPTSGSVGRFESMEEYERMVRATSSAPASSATPKWRTSTSDRRTTCRRWSCGCATPARWSTTPCSSPGSSVPPWSGPREADEAADPLPRRPAPIQRTAMWRAARSGLSGDLLGAWR